jgi:hypothetical protein
MNGLLNHLELPASDFRRVDANRRCEAQARAAIRQAALQDYITADFEQRFEQELRDAYARLRPPEQRKHFDGFIKFAREHGLDPLPALPALAAGYLLSMAIHGKAPLDDIKLAYKSIIYAHDLKELYVDRTFLDAAMQVISEIGRDGGGGGGGKLIPLTPTRTQITAGSDEMPLAAGGA